MGGYYAMFWALQYHANKEMVQQLDEGDYSDGETVVIKVPMTLPYQINWTGFERVNGEFEHHGEFYQLVKEKLENDTLSIVCIRDHKEKQIVSTLVDFTKQSNDLPATTSNLKALGNFLKEYNATSGLEITECEGWNATICFNNPSFATHSPVVPVHSPPPKACC